MTANDIVTSIGDSMLQHGKYNDRIYLMKLSRGDFPGIIEELDRLARANNYSKIFAKVPSFAKNGFEESGYLEEAAIPNFYDGREDVYFMGKYFEESRMQPNNCEKIKEILKSVAQKKIKPFSIGDISGFDYELCDASDASEVADVYKNVFETYPFPIHDPQYVMKTMDENVIYFSIRDNDKIVALSSSEMDVRSQTVEMTDFATLPDYRGKGLGLYLLDMMENEMLQRGIKTAYTIARAGSEGINAIFAKMGYTYSGTLLNNTNIAGNIESMNVWYKFL